MIVVSLSPREDSRSAFAGGLHGRMVDGIFQEREHAMEVMYFRAHDAKLLDALRQKANLDAISTALAEKLASDRPDLLQRVRSLGITAPRAAAFLLMPLIQVAWIDGAPNR